MPRTWDAQGRDLGYVEDETDRRRAAAAPAIEAIQNANPGGSWGASGNYTSAGGQVAGNYNQILSVTAPAAVGSTTGGIAGANGIPSLGAAGLADLAQDVANGNPLQGELARRGFSQAAVAAIQARVSAGASIQDAIGSVGSAPQPAAQPNAPPSPAAPAPAGGQAQRFKPNGAVDSAGGIWTTDTTTGENVYVDQYGNMSRDGGKTYTAMAGATAAQIASGQGPAAAPAAPAPAPGGPTQQIQPALAGGPTAWGVNGNVPPGMTSKNWSDPATGWLAVSIPGAGAGYLKPDGSVVNGQNQVIWEASATRTAAASGGSQAVTAPPTQTGQPAAVAAPSVGQPVQPTAPVAPAPPPPAPSPPPAPPPVAPSFPTTQTYQGVAPDWALFQRDPAAYAAWQANQARVAAGVVDSPRTAALEALQNANPGGSFTVTPDGTPVHVNAAGEATTLASLGISPTPGPVTIGQNPVAPHVPVPAAPPAGAGGGGGGGGPGGGGGGAPPPPAQDPNTLFPTEKTWQEKLQEWLGTQMSTNLDDYRNAMPAPNQIVARNWYRLPASSREFLLGTYEAMGYDPGDVEETISRTTPTWRVPRYGMIR